MLDGVCSAHKQPQVHPVIEGFSFQVTSEPEARALTQGKGTLTINESVLNESIFEFRKLAQVNEFGSPYSARESERANLSFAQDKNISKSWARQRSSRVGQISTLSMVKGQRYPPGPGCGQESRLISMSHQMPCHCT